MNLLVIELFAVMCLAAGSFTSGWWLKGKVDQAAIEQEHEQTRKAVDAFHEQEKAVAATLEKTLADLKSNYSVIDHETLKILDRPVYRFACLDADGLRLLEAARTGKAPATKPSGSMSRASQPH